MATPVRSPLALLQQMQQASRRNAPMLPEQAQAVKLWSGLAFRLHELQLVSPLDQVSEVLPCPAVTLVPGTRPWVKGVANVRGNLLTIIDLPEFFGRPAVRLDERARLLIINLPEMRSALLVTDVMGLRHFDEEQERQALTGLDDAVFAHVRGAFLRNETLWGIFDVFSLAESHAFKQVAA